jgi:hypothetical protein
MGQITTPQQFPYSTSIAAGGTFNPLTDWQYETPDTDVTVQILERATATGLVSSCSSGGDTIKQESPVQAGGTAGTTPARLNTEPITGKGHSGKKLRLAYRNPTGGAITVDGVVILIPGGAFGRGGGGRRRARPSYSFPMRRRRR